MSSKAILGGLVAAAVLGLGGVAQADPTVANAGFESSSYSANSQFGANSFGQGVTGWTGTGYELYFVGGTQTTVSAANQYNDPKTYLRPNVTTSPNGGNFVALDGDISLQSGSTISQTINGLTPGLQYDVGFDWAASELINRTGATTERLAVDFGSDAQTTATVSVPSGGFSGWMQQSFRFTASSASEVLTFLSFGTSNGSPPVALLDSVSVTQAVPEPASWATLVLGLAVLGGTLRTLRRQT
jgi:hypothetical protein